MSIDRDCLNPVEGRPCFGGLRMRRAASGYRAGDIKGTAAGQAGVGFSSWSSSACMSSNDTPLVSMTHFHTNSPDRIAHSA